jgi:hypothetical protein
VKFNSYALESSQFVYVKFAEITHFDKLHIFQPISSFDLCMTFTCFFHREFTVSIILLARSHNFCVELHFLTM